jgi:outer membrane protein TolC
MVGKLPEKAPLWDADLVRQRVMAVNTRLKQAVVEAEQARLQVERARAAAVPNVTIGGGWSKNFADPEAGAARRKWRSASRSLRAENLAPGLPICIPRPAIEADQADLLQVSALF